MINEQISRALQLEESGNTSPINCYVAYVAVLHNIFAQINSELQQAFFKDNEKILKMASYCLERAKSLAGDLEIPTSIHDIQKTCIVASISANQHEAKLAESHRKIPSLSDLPTITRISAPAAPSSHSGTPKLPPPSPSNSSFTQPAAPSTPPNPPTPGPSVAQQQHQLQQQKQPQQHQQSPLVLAKLKNDSLRLRHSRQIARINAQRTTQNSSVCDQRIYQLRLSLQRTLTQNLQIATREEAHYQEALNRSCANLNEQLEHYHSCCRAILQPQQQQQQQQGVGRHDIISPLTVLFDQCFRYEFFFLKSNWLFQQLRNSAAGTAADDATNNVKILQFLLRIPKHPLIDYLRDLIGRHFNVPHKINNNDDAGGGDANNEDVPVFTLEHRLEAMTQQLMSGARVINAYLIIEQLIPFPDRAATLETSSHWPQQDDVTSSTSPSSLSLPSPSHKQRLSLNLTGNSVAAIYQALLNFVLNSELLLIGGERTLFENAFEMLLVEHREDLERFDALAFLCSATNQNQEREQEENGAEKRELQSSNQKEQVGEDEGEKRESHCTNQKHHQQEEEKKITIGSRALSQIQEKFVSERCSHAMRNTLLELNQIVYTTIKLPAKSSSSLPTTLINAEQNNAQSTHCNPVNQSQSGGRFEPMKFLSRVCQSISNLVQSLTMLCNSNDDDKCAIGADELQPIITYLILEFNSSFSDSTLTSFSFSLPSYLNDVNPKKSGDNNVIKRGDGGVGRFFILCKMLELLVDDQNLRGADGYVLMCMLASFQFCLEQQRIHSDENHLECADEDDNHKKHEIDINISSETIEST